MMWVTTSKCYAANTTDLQSLVCKVWSTQIPSLHREKEVILLQHILFSQGASICFRHLFGEGIIKGLFGAACDRVNSDKKTVLCRGVI